LEKKKLQYLKSRISDRNLGPMNWREHDHNNFQC